MPLISKSEFTAGLQLRTMLLITALVPFLALVVLHWPLLPPIEAGDYAQYILHAKAILDGRPYGDIGYIYTPLRALVGPPLLPPGLPLTIAPILAISDVHSSLLRVPLVVSVVAFLYCVWRYLSVRYSPWVAFGAAAMTGVALESAYATVVVISDLGFCALIWATILVADRETPWTFGRAAAMTLLGFAAMSYRVAGIALIPAAVAFWIVNRQRIGDKVLLVPACWVAAGLLAAREHIVDLAPALLFRRMPHVLDQLGSRFDTYRQASFDALLYPFPWAILNHVYHVLALLAGLVGLVIIVRSRWRSFLVLMTLAYGAMLALTPVHDARYAWPFFPLLGAALVMGSAQLLRLARRSWTGNTERSLVLAMVLPIVAFATVRVAMRPARPTLLGNADVQALFAQVTRTMSPAKDRVVFMNPRVLTLETGIPAMAIFAATGSAEAMHELARKRIDFVITGDFGLYAAASATMAKAISENADRFAVRYRNPSFTMYQLLSTADSARASVPSNAR